VKILILHNYYKQIGGEDFAVRRETALLKAAGHQIMTYFRDSRDIDETSLVAKVATGSKAIWARDSHRELTALLKREKPDLAHFHNTFPLISPSACYACRDAGVPIVLTLHNYRLFCAPGTFFRNGSICEECLEHGPWVGVRHACYRGSRMQTAGAALTLAIHQKLRTWSRMVDCYIAPTRFVRGKFGASGFPLEKIFVKPNFVDPDPGERIGEGEYAISAGRITVEKGLQTLIAAWATLGRHIPLVIVGDGPQRGELERETAQRGVANIIFKGSLSNADTIIAMKRAKFFVFPSKWYETFGTTIVEAFACGVPVLCSSLGAMQELVENGRTGLHFKAGDPADLAAKINWAWTHPAEMERMGRAARIEYETKFTPKHNYDLLMGAYKYALSGTGEFVEKLVPEIWADMPDVKAVTAAGKK
jgi:glycosyltransferase involved in cell wall biosynthesis